MSTSHRKISYIVSRLPHSMFWQVGREITLKTAGAGLQVAAGEFSPKEISEACTQLVAQGVLRKTAADAWLVLRNP